MLWDAIRKVVGIISVLCEENEIAGWRQVESQLRKVKKLLRVCQKTRKSNSKKTEKQKRKNEQNKQSHRDYTAKVSELLDKATVSLQQLSSIASVNLVKLADVAMFINDGKHQIDLIHRRVLNGEKIPNCDKIHSLFERHTEWICKGKAGISQELGKRVCIIEDQYGFVLHHEVMNKVGDKDMVVPFIKRTKELFPSLESSSFDKGYWQPGNKDALEEIITVALPKKGRLSKEAAAYEKSPEFIEAANKHSAVESCINALENHGLDRCLDKGEKSFNRYIALAVLGRNIQQLGTVIIKQEKIKKKLSEKIKKGLRIKAATLALAS